MVMNIEVDGRQKRGEPKEIWKDKIKEKSGYEQQEIDRKTLRVVFLYNTEENEYRIDFFGLPQTTSHKVLETNNFL